MNNQSIADWFSRKGCNWKKFAKLKISFKLYIFLILQYDLGTFLKFSPDTENLNLL